MQNKNVINMQDQLLKRVLDECMEEQLSFVPPEREIARTHQFSPGFLAGMAKILDEQEKKKEDRVRKLDKREFIYGFSKAAACILVLLVVGALSFAGFVLFSPKGSSESAKMSQETTAEAPAEAMPEEMKEESAMEDAVPESTEETTTVSAEESKAEPTKGEESGHTGSGQGKIPDAAYLGGTLKAAPAQNLAESFGEVEIVLNSPVIRPEAEEMMVTIGNMEDHTIYYYEDLDLEVFLNGYWYTVPPLEAPEEEKMVILEAGMARDENIHLSDYQLDREAEEYRVVVYLDGATLCAPFSFGEELFETEEKKEEVE